MKSETLSKMRALRQAKQLGCSGAHKTEDGKWHPCASAEALRAIDPSRLKRTTAPLIIKPPQRRENIGAAKIKKQWENLGEGGIVSIDTISGGGLVSGVIGKSLVPGSPSDDDPDVFSDIESARTRSRQLGCIGVSRRISRSGRTVWMPCTNMSDLASRTGRTSLGRRNMEMRSQRYITEALKRREAEIRPARMRKKSLLEDIHGIQPALPTPYRVKAHTKQETKALGPKIGRGLRSAPPGMTFVDVTGAIDGDKDGIVFEGKPLERPIIPRFVLPDGIARRVQKLIEGRAEENEKNRRMSGSGSVGEINQSELASLIGVSPEPVETRSNDELLNSLRQFSSRSRGVVRDSSFVPQASIDAMGDSLPPIDAGVPFTRRAQKSGRRAAKRSFERIDDSGDDYRYMSALEIDDVVREMIPTDQASLEQALKSSPYTRQNWKRVLERISAAEVDWSAQAVAQELISQQVANNSMLSSMIREYGMPPIVATSFQPDIENLGFINASTGPKSWFTTVGGWSGAGFIGINAGIFERLDKQGRNNFAAMSATDNPDYTIRHELAHAWETMAARRGGPARERYIQQYQEIAEGLFGIYERGEETFTTSYHSAPWGTEAEHRSALKISEYAESARIEWFAESFASFTDQSIDKRNKVDSLSIQNMAAVLGKTTSEIMAMSLDFGFHELITSSRSKSSPVGKLFDVGSKDVREAVAFIQDNPGWIADAPSDLLTLLSPDEVRKALSDNVSYLSSMRSSLTNIDKSLKKAEEARRNGELGQQIIDVLFANATGDNDSGAYPTLWFIGGTTGSGKTTLRNLGVLEGVPPASVAVDIDPDVIKSMHPRWNGGKGAQEIHQWSTQWTRYGLSQALALEKDAVVTGTGVRTEQLSAAKRVGYLTVGHFVHVPAEQAQRQMKARAADGGTNLPVWFADRYSSELQRVVPRAITSGELDEFFLWDNSGPTPKLAAFRKRDGSFAINDRSVFEAFFSKRGAEYVEKYWKDNPNGPEMARPSSRSSSRSISNLYPIRIAGDKAPRRVGKKDLEEIVYGPVEIDIGLLDDSVTLDMRDWFGSTIKTTAITNKKTNRPVLFESTNIIRVDMSSFSLLPGSTFAYSRLVGVRFKDAQLDGVDFSHSDLQNVDFSGASLKASSFIGARINDADFSDADLTDSKFDIKTLKESGIRWNAKTKFPPEVAEFLAKQPTDTSPDGKISIAIPRALQRTRHPGKFSSDTYKRTRRNKRIGIAGVPSGPRTAFDERAVRSGSEFTVKDQSFSEIDISYRGFKPGSLNVENTTVIDSILTEVSAPKSVFINSRINGVNAQFLFAPDSQFVNSSFKDSDLSHAVLRGSKITGTLDLTKAILFRADFSGIKFGEQGRIDMRGAVMRDADLTGLDWRRVLYDDSTDFDGAKGLPPQIISRKPKSKNQNRSSRSISSKRDALESIGFISDELHDVRSLTESRKNALRDMVADTYRDLFNLTYDLDYVNSELGLLRDSLSSSIERLDKLRNIRIGESTNIDLLADVELGRKDSFIKKFSEIRSTDPSFMSGYSPEQAWRFVSQDISGRDSTIGSIDEFEGQQIDLRDAINSAPTLAYVLHSNFSDFDVVKKSDGALPKGKKVGPLNQSSRSIRETRGLGTGEYFKELLGDKNFKEFYDSLEDNPETEDIFRYRVQEFAYLFDQEIKAFLDGEYDAMPVHPSIGTTVKDIIGNGKIVIYSDGTHSLVMPPNPILAGLLSTRRDWGSVELPSKETVMEARARLSASPRVDISKNSVDQNTGDARLVGLKLAKEIIPKMEAVERRETTVPNASTSAPYIQQYLTLISDPHRFLRGYDAESIDALNDPMALLHDTLGHFAIGRGFDRHGEWATTLATIDLIRNSPSLTPLEKQAGARYVLARFGGQWLDKRFKGDEHNGWEMYLDTILYDGDIFDIIDTLDQKAPSSRSMRSSVRSESPVETPALLQKVGRDEVIGHASRRGLDVPSRVSAELNKRRAAQRPAQRIARTSGRTMAASRSLTGTPSSRSSAKGKQPSLVKRFPKLVVGDDGSVSLDPNEKGVVNPRKIAASPITEGDIPADFMKNMPGAARLLHYRGVMKKWLRENALQTNDDGTFSADNLIDDGIVGELLSERASTAIFTQAVAKNLTDGQAVIVRNIPGDSHSSFTKTAVLMRYGRNLVAIELDSESSSALFNALHKAQDEAGGRITGNTSSTAEVFSIEQLESLIPNNGPTSIGALRDTILDYQAMTASADPDLPAPGILIKLSPFNGLLPIPPEEIERFGGEDAARKSIKGIAARLTSAVTMYAHDGVDSTLLTHEWGHVVDFHRGTEPDSKGISVVGNLSAQGKWGTAREADLAHGQQLMSEDKDLKLAFSEGRLLLPQIRSGRGLSLVGRNLQPVIGQSGVSRYGGTDPAEDFAESARFMMIDDLYGHLLEEVDFDGKLTGKVWTFAELFPERKKILDSAMYSSRSRSQSGADEFQKRFKSLAGHDSPNGDGDCYVAAVDAIDRLASPEFGFSKSNMRVVHGIPLGTGGEAQGVRYGHAWVEVAPFDMKEHDAMERELSELLDEFTTDITINRKKEIAQRVNEIRQRLFENEMSIMVYDFSNGREAIFPRAIYYAIGNINKEDARYYSPVDAAKMMAKNEHYGPWE